MNFRSVCVALAVLIVLPIALSAQNRDYRSQRIILDDNGAGATTNTMTIQPATLSADHTLTLPAPSGATGEILISNPSAPQVVTGEMQLASNGTNPTLTVNNSNAAGTGLAIAGGGLTVSSANFASGGTITANVVSASVTGASDATVSTVTLPTGTNGQILYISTTDVDGLEVYEGATLLYILADDNLVVTLIHAGGQWKPIP